MEAQVVTSANMLQYEWTHPNADATNTYYSAGPGPTAPNLEWALEIPGLADQEFHYGGSTLTAFNGLLFFSQGRAGTFPGIVAAIDPFSGVIVWKKDGVSGACVKIDDNYMMMGSRCVKIADGSSVWDPPAGFSGTYVPEIKMFVSTTYGWSLPDPTQPPILVWNRTSELNVHPGYSCYGDGKVFIGDAHGGFLRAIDARTGTQIWKVGVTTSFIYGMSYYEGKIIHGGLDNNMRAWNANTGELLWTYNPGGYYGQWASGTAVGNGLVYEHNQDTYVYALNANTGELVWRQKGPGIAYSNKLTIAGDKLYVQQGESQYRDFATGEFGKPEFDCYDALTGELLWSIPVECQAGPGLAQCNAYGNLYMVPSYTANTPGIYFGGFFVGEIWCLSSETKDWNMFQADPEHSGIGAGPTNVALKWKYKAEGQIYSNPTVVNNVVYFGCLDGNVYAISADSATKLWTFQTGFPMVSSPAVVNGKLYTGADSGYVYCLDAASGTQLWKTFVGGKTNSMLSSGSGGSVYSRSSPVVVNDKVYVGALDKHVYCFDANTGNILWQFFTDGEVRATATVVDGAVYIPSCTPATPGVGRTGFGSLYKLDANTGEQIWRSPIPYSLNRSTYGGNWMYASAIVGKDVVTIRSGIFYTFGVNATTGDIIWKYEARHNPGTPGQTGGVIQINSPLYKYGKIYMNDFYGIVCLNVTTGKEIWYTYLSREDLSEGIAYSFGRLYIVIESRVLHVLDALTGSKLSNYDQFGSQMHSAPSLYDGRLYVGCMDWNLYCFEEAGSVSKQFAEPLTTQASIEAPLETASPIINSGAGATLGNEIYIVIGELIVAASIIVAAVILRRRK